MYNIAFVILTWNSEKCIGKCIKSIIGMDESVFSGSIVVVDNGSSDQSISIIEREFSHHQMKTNFITELIKLGKNYGTTYSRNVGIMHALKGNAALEYICILDSDTIVNTEAFQALLGTLKEHANCGIIGPRMRDERMIYQRSGRHIPTLAEKLFKVLPIKKLREKGIKLEATVPEEGTGCVKVGYLFSACWVMRKELFDQVGFLDEKIFYAPEDVDFCIRCWKKGYYILYCYDAEIIHEWQRLSRKKLFSKHNFEHIKGLIYMFWKHKFLFSTKKFISM